MPAAPSAPPPSAPAAAPAPTSSPPPAPAAPKPSAASTPPPEPKKALDDVYAELDALDKADTDSKDKRQSKVEAPPKPDDDDQTPAPQKKGEFASKTDDDAPAPVKLNDLRNAYANLKKKVKEEYEPKVQSAAKLEARIKELEQTNPAEITTLQEKLSAAEKRRDELEQQIHFVDYSKSTEFKQKYEQPYHEAWAKARKDLAELVVENEDGTTRAATDNDMIQLANMPLGAARKLATTLFGDSANDVMLHRQRIIDLSAAQEKALDDARNMAGERAKMSDVERKASQEKTLKMWSEANQAISQKFPKTFGKIEDDPEGNAVLEKGFALADRLFKPTEETRPKTPEEAVRLHALIRHKIANHDRALTWLKKARGRISELEAALAEYENSDPNGGLDGGAPAGGAMSFDQDVAAEIDRLDRQNR